MIGISEIKGVKFYCEQSADAFRKRLNGPGGSEADRKTAQEFAAVADMLEKATPEALYLLIDTGLFNEIIRGYATEAARLAGFSGSDLDAIRDGVRDALSEYAAETTERKELER